MQVIKRSLFLALVAALFSLSFQQARAELIAATDNPNTAYLAPLRNGLSSLTLVWHIDYPTKERVTALTAGLSSVVFGGTSSRSAFDIRSFISLKGVIHKVGTNGENLFLTVSAPDDVFPETLVHLENLLGEPEYSSGWYTRQLEKLRPRISSKSGRPADVLGEITAYLEYPAGDAVAVEGDREFRFGRPSQVILRSGDKEVEQRTARLIDKLPPAKARPGNAFANWVGGLIGAKERAFTLPKGTIHFADPDSSEMLILFAKAEEFADDDHQIGAHLLVDYIGGTQGSELFRIVRQEMRAAYDPRSEFIVMDKYRALIGVSATVEAETWPEVYGRIWEIYEGTRAGRIERTGLDIQYDILRRKLFNAFFSDPVWGVRHYLNEYPEGAHGTLRFPIFEALEAAPLGEIMSKPERYLPPLEDYLVILIGGGRAPKEALRSNGYCALPKNTPLSFCLDALSNEQN